MNDLPIGYVVLGLCDDSDPKGIVPQEKGADDAPSKEDTVSEAKTPKSIHGQEKSVGTTSDEQAKKSAEKRERLMNFLS